MGTTSQREVVVGIAQWLPVGGDSGDTLGDAGPYIEQLAVEGCELVVLPELWPCAHDPAHPAAVAKEVRRRAETIDGARTRALARTAREHGIWLAAGSVPERTDHGIFNTALLFSPDGSLHATHRKAHLYRPMHEDLAFEPGACVTACDTELLGRIGLLVCFDGDFPEVARALRSSGARVVIQVNAYELAAESWWDRIYPANALSNGQWWIMANQCGTRGATTFLGASRIISPLGDVVAEAPRAKQGETPDPALLVHRIELDNLIARADREAGALVRHARRGLPVELNRGRSDALAIQT
ncbi:MAG: carbon-nitrogen hydrolase family protein [Solirubrobacterales bacterium]